MPSSLDLTLGAIEMGTMMSMMLYGMITVQMYMYAMTCKADRPWLKALVTSVWYACATVLSIHSPLSIFSGVLRHYTLSPCSRKIQHHFCWDDRLI
jgi:hypothetical protein